MTPIIADGGEEAIIYGCLNEYLIAWHCHCLDNGRERRHHTTGIDEPLALRTPAMTAAEPLYRGGIEGFGYGGISEAAMLQSSAQGSEDAGGSLKVHVGDAVADGIIVWQRIVFIAVGAATVYRGIEIVYHNAVLKYSSLLCLNKFCTAFYLNIKGGWVLDARDIAEDISFHRRVLK